MGTSVFAQMPVPSARMNVDDNGVMIIESNIPLQSYSRCVGDWLDVWARETTDKLFIAERRQGEWFGYTYGEFREKVRSLAQGLINHGVAGKGPVLILSGNSVNHALLKMAAMYIGIPVTSLSVAYSMFPGKYDRLKAAVESLDPALVFAEDGLEMGNALAAVRHNRLVMLANNSAAVADCLSLDELCGCEVSDEVDRLFGLVEPATHAKYMLTSGSTGHPKMVVVTQRMMCANQQMIAQCLPFVETTPPVVLDWLPWSHTFGTNHNFNLVLRNGGTLYIDEGRPMPGQIEATIANIRDVKPTLFFNVPKGYEALLPYLEADKTFAAAFFEKLQMLFYAAAALSVPVWNDLKRLAAEQGAEVFFTTEWGSTETAPANTCVHWRLEKAGNIGVPMPGVSIKLIPNGSKLEIRVKGPNVFDEYLNEPEKTAESFDEEGFYRIGDAGRLAEPGNPSAGILFDGRVSEDFKLSTGTWVCVATIRQRLQEQFKGLVSDALITGHDRDYLAVVVFPSPGIRALAGDPTGNMSAAELLASGTLAAVLLDGLQAIAGHAKGSSQKICKLLLADTPASIELGEVTDKGNLNQRKLLDTRRELIERIYSEKDDATVLSIIK
jgi:feruloyl-CoA synthase